MTNIDGSGSETGRAPGPLSGRRVLDLTRILAGLGVEVLRVDPPDWEEPAVVPR